MIVEIKIININHTLFRDILINSHAEGDDNSQENTSYKLKSDGKENKHREHKDEECGEVGIMFEED